MNIRREKFREPSIIRHSIFCQPYCGSTPNWRKFGWLIFERKPGTRDSFSKLFFCFEWKITVYRKRSSDPRIFHLQLQRTVLPAHWYHFYSSLLWFHEMKIYTCEIVDSRWEERSLTKKNIEVTAGPIWWNFRWCINEENLSHNVSMVVSWKFFYDSKFCIWMKFSVVLPLFCGNRATFFVR